MTIDEAVDEAMANYVYNEIFQFMNAKVAFSTSAAIEYSTYYDVHWEISNYTTDSSFLATSVIIYSSITKSIK